MCNSVDQFLFSCETVCCCFDRLHLDLRYVFLLVLFTWHLRRRSSRRSENIFLYISIYIQIYVYIYNKHQFAVFTLCMCVLLENNICILWMWTLSTRLGYGLKVTRHWRGYCDHIRVVWVVKIETTESIANRTKAHSNQFIISALSVAAAKNKRKLLYFCVFKKTNKTFSLSFWL